MTEQDLRRAFLMCVDGVLEDFNEALSRHIRETLERDAEIARLREALEPFAKAAEKCDGLDRRVQDSIPVSIDDLFRARTALASLNKT